ncbi:MAG: protein O-mannosyl-transferase family [candidate division WOR-3 bacterium]|jgi:tetratricopeptide (TPR) repeat protein
MNESRWRLVIFILVFLVVAGVYLYSVAPTASFWDCAELIAVSYIAGVPHPPGTPLFVMLGRIFTMLPLGREIAFRVNLIPALFGAFSCGLLYLIIVKILSINADREKERRWWLPHIAGVFGALMCGFAYSYWDNCVEAEVYGPCVVIALTVLYLALVWRTGREKGTGDNRQILAAIFLLFVATGIHFTPMLVVFAVLIFALLVDRHAVIHLRFIEFMVGYLLILTINEMGLSPGTFIVVPLMLAGTYYAIQIMDRSEQNRTLIYGLALLAGVFLIAYLGAGQKLMDDVVLFLASPTVAFIERWFRSPVLVIVFILGYGGYLYWLRTKKQLRAGYVGLLLGLVLLAGTVQFIMLIRARHYPSINEVEPARWRDFVSVLKREQYDPMRLFPRKTQFLTEDDWRANRNPVFDVFRAYIEQIAFYKRYFLWQWGNERFLDVLFTNIPHIFLRLGWQGILGLIPPLLGIWGMVHQFKRDRKSFALILVAFLVASLGLLTYLNLKFSPSDPRPELKFREVRERDYFFAFSFVFYTIFIGNGAYALLKWADAELKKKQLVPLPVVAGLVLLFGFVPMLLNYQTVTRRHNWIPAEYGYNMLICCEGEKAVVFTNGDNDTFPLWFMQTVPSIIANNDPNFGKNVAVANLSLLNTTWYCKQLKRWGAPISFTEAEIERLPQGFVAKNNRVILLKDIMIRNIIATAGGVRLNWPQDYESSPQEFMQKVFAPGYQPKSPVYFATTVSPDNMEDVQPYLRLEGLVYRVVPERERIPGEGQIDTARTRRLLFEQFKMKSMLDPRVAKDDNTRGLLITYAHSHLLLAMEYARTGNYQAAIAALQPALRFELEGPQKMLLFYHYSRFAALTGNYPSALNAVDSALVYAGDDPRLRLELTLQRGLIAQGMGNYSEAERMFQQARAMQPDEWQLVNILYRLYVDNLHAYDRARDLLKDWLRRHPDDSNAARLLRELP